MSQKAFEQQIPDYHRGDRFWIGRLILNQSLSELEDLMNAYPLQDKVKRPGINYLSSMDLKPEYLPDTNDSDELYGNIMESSGLINNIVADEYIDVNFFGYTFRSGRKDNILKISLIDVVEDDPEDSFILGKEYLAVSELSLEEFPFAEQIKRNIKKGRPSFFEAGLGYVDLIKISESFTPHQITVPGIVSLGPVGVHKF